MFLWLNRDKTGGWWRHRCDTHPLLKNCVPWLNKRTYSTMHMQYWTPMVYTINTYTLHHVQLLCSLHSPPTGALCRKTVHTQGYTQDHRRGSVDTSLTPAASLDSITLWTRILSQLRMKQLFRSVTPPTNTTTVTHRWNPPRKTPIIISVVHPHTILVR